MPSVVGSINEEPNGVRKPPRGAGQSLALVGCTPLLGRAHLRSLHQCLISQLLKLLMELMDWIISIWIVLEHQQAVQGLFTIYPEIGAESPIPSEFPN